LLKNPDDVDSGIQIGQIQFLAQNSGLQNLGSQNIIDEYFLGSITRSTYVDLAIGNRIGIELKAINIPAALGILPMCEGSKKQKYNEVKVLHTRYATNNIPQRYEIQKFLNLQSPSN
jgi:hypothetical protein